jgi:hypothetical protein
MISKLIKFLEIYRISSRFILISLSTILIIIKDGFDLYGDKHLRESLALFPRPYDGTSSSYFPMFLLKVLNLNERQWNIFNFCLILVFIFTVGFYLLFRFTLKHGFILFSIFINSPSITILFQQIGHYQTLFVITSILFTLFRNKYLSFICGSFMVLSTPEYSLISLVLLYLWSKGTGMQNFLYRIKIFLCFSLFLFVLNFITMKKANVDGRLDGLNHNFAKSLESFAASGYLGIYAGWGSMWIIIVFVIRMNTQNRKNLSYLVSAIFFIPVIFYIITADGTRIFVGLTSIMLMPIIFSFSNLNSKLIKIDLLFLFWLLPNFISEIGSPYFKLPFEFVRSDKFEVLKNLFRQLN